MKLQVKCMDKLVIAFALVVVVLALILLMKPSVLEMVTKKEAATPEEMAMSEIEEELSKAVENITMEDIENALLTQE